MSCETSHIRALPTGRAASSRGTLLPASAGMGIGGTSVSENGISSFLVWLKLWLSCVADGVILDVWADVFSHSKKSNLVKGYQRPPSLLPDSQRAAIAPHVLCGRRRRRIIARGLPASRRYDGLQYLNDRQLTGNQFLERACRLSVNGRVGIYGLEYRLRLCQRRHEFCMTNVKTHVPSHALSRKRVSFGLCVFHLGPD